MPFGFIRKLFGGGGSGVSASAQADTAAARELYETQAGISREMWDTYKSRGLPILEDIGTDLEKMIGPEAIAAAEGRAATDVRQAYGRQRQGLMQSLARYGVKPGSGRFTSALRSLALGEAGDVAGARTGARVGILDRAMRGKFGLAGAYQGQAGQVLSGLGAAGSGFAGLRRLDDQRRAQREQQRAATWSGLAQLGGSLGGAFILASDRRLKRNVEPIDTLSNGLVVYEFTYIDDPETVYTGLMADEVEKVMPQHVGECAGFQTVDYKGVIEELCHG